MADFRTLVQEFVAELGIGGADNGATIPSSVLNQTGQLWNASNWIKQAHNNICLLHTDWNFLYFEYSEPLVVGSRAVPTHSGVEVPKKFAKTAWFIDPTLNSGAHLQWLDWREFRDNFTIGSAVFSSSKPSYITTKPDGTMLLDTPADSTYTLTGEGWRRPTVLAADSDVPDFPQEYHRLIITEAAIKYGNKEAAIEVIQGMEAEYIMLLEGLESDQLPMREFERQGAEDYEITIDIPGHDDTRRVR